MTNGTPQDSVTLSHGIRQSDLLSPYLFILSTKVLSVLGNNAQEKGTLSGIRVSCRSPQVTHFLFVNDTMFSANRVQRVFQNFKRSLAFMKRFRDSLLIFRNHLLPSWTRPRRKWRLEWRQSRTSTHKGVGKIPWPSRTLQAEKERHLCVHLRHDQTED